MGSPSGSLFPRPFRPGARCHDEAPTNAHRPDHQQAVACSAQIFARPSAHAGESSPR